MKNTLTSALFKLVLIQEGEGCDYTIGCGVKVLDLTATNLLAAQEESRSMLGKDDYDWLNSSGDTHIKQAILVTTCQLLPIERWRRLEVDEEADSRL